ncbi:hypothetical protein L1987_87264 [Smallanthus sonchifolius]|nr:hypothetical protein L1987_87264 [Smallanthus sonchifolius]
MKTLHGSKSGGVLWWDRKCEGRNGYDACNVDLSNKSQLAMVVGGDRVKCGVPKLVYTVAFKRRYLRCFSSSLKP